MFSKEIKIAAVSAYLSGMPQSQIRQKYHIKGSTTLYKTYPRELINNITSIRDENPDYGYRRITAELHHRGLEANHKVVLKIMTINGLLCTALIDVYNSEILTWNIDLHPTVEFVTKPLDELLKQRSERHYRMTIHSDQGFQYQNCDYVSRLVHNRVFQSMSRKATCLDNAMTESICHILKVGTVHNNHYQSYDELKYAIADYVHYYNRRIKTKMAGKTPVQYRYLFDQLAA